MQWWPWKTTRNVFYAPQNCPFCSSLFGLKLGLSKNSQKLWSNELFFTGVSFELDKWPWRTIGYLLYTPRSFVHHFIATCELKLELSSRNAEIVAKLAVFGSRGLEIWRMTLKTVGHLFHVNRSFVHHFTAICEFWKWSYLPENLKSGQIGYFWPAWYRNFADDLKNYNIENAIWHTL